MINSILKLYNLFCILLVVLFSSCEKSRPLLPYNSSTIESDIDLRGIHYTQNGSIYISGGNNKQGYVFISEDKGINWAKKSFYFDKQVNDIWIDDNEIGFCADNDVLIYKTISSGNSWEQYYPDVWPLSVTRNLRDIFKQDSTNYFICGGKNFGNGLIYTTSNAGIDWTFIEFSHELRGIHFNNSGNGIAVGYGIILSTTNNGKTWNVINSKREFYTGVTGDGNNSYWLCGFNGGLYYSPNSGIDWHIIKKTNGAFSSRDRFSCIDRSANGSLVACGFDGLVAISKDNGNSWKYYNSFSGNSINNVKIINNNQAIAIGDEGRIFRFQL